MVKQQERQCFGNVNHPGFRAQDTNIASSPVQNCQQQKSPQKLSGVPANWQFPPNNKKALLNGRGKMKSKCKCSKYNICLICTQTLMLLHKNLEWDHSFWVWSGPLEFWLQTWIHDWIWSHPQSISEYLINIFCSQTWMEIVPSPSMSNSWKTSLNSSTCNPSHDQIRWDFGHDDFDIGSFWYWWAKLFLGGQLGPGQLGAGDQLSIDSFWYWWAQLSTVLGRQLDLGQFGPICLEPWWTWWWLECQCK